MSEWWFRLPQLPGQISSPPSKPRAGAVRCRLLRHLESRDLLSKELFGGNLDNLNATITQEADADVQTAKDAKRRIK